MLKYCLAQLKIYQKQTKEFMELILFIEYLHSAVMQTIEANFKYLQLKYLAFLSNNFSEYSICWGKRTFQIKENERKNVKAKEIRT